MKIKRYQMGGQAPVAPGDPAMEGGAPTDPAMGRPEQGGPQGGGMEEQLAQIAQQLLEMLLQQIGDPNAVAMVLQIAMQMLQEAAGGQGAPQGEPVFKKGGKLSKKRCAKRC